MKPHARTMPRDLDQPETRAEAMADRESMIEKIIDIPSQLEKRSLKWFIIALALLIFMMAGGAVYYTQLQLKAMQSENLALRDKLTEYLVSANLSTVAALDRCTSALREQTQTNRDVKEVLTQLLQKHP